VTHPESCKDSIAAKSSRISMVHCTAGPARTTCSSPSAPAFTTPSGEKLLDWLLFTNAKVVNLADAMDVVTRLLAALAQDFHKTWKSGARDVASSQLRSAHAIVAWATILAAAAVRVERLKKLSRTDPGRTAGVELSHAQKRALIILKRRKMEA
jgi:hypothetical protein